MAKDPLRFEGGDTNLFAYVMGAPVNRREPTGLTVYLCSRIAELSGDRATNIENGYLHMWLWNSETGSEAGLGPDPSGSAGIFGGLFGDTILADHRGAHNEESWKNVECAPQPAADEACVEEYIHETNCGDSLGSWMPLLSQGRQMRERIFADCAEQRPSAAFRTSKGAEDHELGVRDGSGDDLEQMQSGVVSQVEVFEYQGQRRSFYRTPQERHDRVEHRLGPLVTFVPGTRRHSAKRFAQLGRNSHQVMLEIACQGLDQRRAPRFGVAMQHLGPRPKGGRRLTLTAAAPAHVGAGLALMRREPLCETSFSDARRAMHEYDVAVPCAVSLAARRRRSISGSLPKKERSRADEGIESLELAGAQSSPRKRKPLPRTVAMYRGAFGSSPRTARA